MIRRHALTSALLLALTFGCKTNASESQAKDDALAAAPPPPTVTTTAASGQMSLNGLLARNGVNGVHLAPTPLVRQTRDDASGAAALQSLLLYWGDEVKDGQLAPGASYHDMVALLNGLNDPAKKSALLAAARKNRTPAAGAYKIELFAGASKQNRTASDAGEAGVPKDGLSSHELERQIDKGHPVLVLLQAWTRRDPPQWSDDMEDGRFAVVVGYDKTSYVFMDPATSGNYAYVPRKEFLDRWHGVDARESLRHFALVVSKDKPAFELDDVRKLD